jgi:hypothetical protein
VKNYLVHYKIDKPNYKARYTKVSIREGYTTFEDIRKILAIGVSATIEQIEIQSLMLVSEED